MRKFIEHLLFLSFFCFLIIGQADDEGTYLKKFLEARRSQGIKVQYSWKNLQEKVEKHKNISPFVDVQYGLMQADKISKLPGQPDDVDFDQYAGYVTVDPTAGRALFYYFVESPTNSSTNPLVLWLNGGPGCSSVGGGAFHELGPFRVSADGKTLFRNNFAWNNVANVIFLESPAGVGFSYSNRSSDYDNTGDTSTANDAYTFLINWLERFPQYKNRDFYITGESYAGHYVPQLAYAILVNNNENTTQTVVNLKGIAIGNALIDEYSQTPGWYDYYWSHALNSDETHTGIRTYCDFAKGNLTDKCETYMRRSSDEMGGIDSHNIYFPTCPNPVLKNNSKNGSINFPDPCEKTYMFNYLNLAEVQEALHVSPMDWSYCRDFLWTDSPDTVLPIIQNLMANGLRVWIYSGDIDPIIPVTSTRYAINSLKLPVVNAWRPWSSNNEVGGYVVGYKGLALVTVRGSGHYVPTDQPQRALTMISAFLQGILPP